MEDIVIVEIDIKYKSKAYMVVKKDLKDQFENRIYYEYLKLKNKGVNIIEIADKGNNINNEEKEHSFKNFSLVYYSDFYKMSKTIDNIKLYKDIKLRKLEKTEINDYVNIYNQCFENVQNAAYVTEDEIKENKENRDFGFIIKDEKIIGFYDLCKNTIEGYGIKKEYRGEKLGEKALYTIINYIKEQNYNNAELLVASENTVAYNLYKKIGFIGDEKRFSRWYIVKER